MDTVLIDFAEFPVCSLRIDSISDNNRIEINKQQLDFLFKTHGTPINITHPTRECVSFRSVDLIVAKFTDLNRSRFPG